MYTSLSNKSSDSLLYKVNKYKRLINCGNLKMNWETDLKILLYI